MPVSLRSTLIREIEKLEIVIDQDLDLDTLTIVARRFDQDATLSGHEVSASASKMAFP